jgi:hypothetical protein
MMMNEIDDVRVVDVCLKSSKFPYVNLEICMYPCFGLI